MELGGWKYGKQSGCLKKPREVRLLTSRGNFYSVS